MTIPDSGDDSIWRLLIEKYYPKIVNYLYLTTGDRYLAEDIAQEAFSVGIDKFDQLKNPNKFLPWMSSIVINVAKTQIKRKNRAIPVEDIEKCMDFPLEDDFSIEMAENKERQLLVQNAIAKLSAQEQSAVTLRYYMDMKDKDIAQAMGVTLGTVKKVLFRARTKLYNELQYMTEKEGEINER